MMSMDHRRDVCHAFLSSIGKAVQEHSPHIRREREERIIAEAQVLVIKYADHVEEYDAKSSS
jgi:hypothetical protein